MHLHQETPPTDSGEEASFFARRNVVFFVGRSNEIAKSQTPKNYAGNPHSICGRLERIAARLRLARTGTSDRWVSGTSCFGLGMVISVAQVRGETMFHAFRRGNDRPHRAPPHGQQDRSFNKPRWPASNQRHFERAPQRRRNRATVQDKMPSERVITPRGGLGAEAEPTWV